MDPADLSSIEKMVRDYLPGIIHMSLATCLDNKPWVCEVHFAYDEALNLYFRSLPSRRHSLEIAANPYTSGTIVQQHVSGEKPRGIYFEGIAEKLVAVDSSSPAYHALHDRFEIGEAALNDAHLDNGHAFYKISVTTYYVFDARETSPGQKYELKWS